MTQKILLLGATGMLGRPLPGHLQAGGYTVRILTRDAARARALFGAEVEILAGDAADRQLLRRALLDVSGVHISLPYQTELPVVRGLVAELNGQPLERITYVSGCTVAPENAWFPLVEAKLQCEALIANTGRPYTIFCPTWVMETLPNFARHRRAAAIQGKQPIPLHFFAAEDFGRMVARAYGEAATIGQRLCVHGPAAIPLHAAIAQYAAAVEKKVMPLPARAAGALGRVTRNRDLVTVSDLIRYFDRVGEMGDPAEANRLLGAPGIRFGEWLAEVG